MANGAKQQGDVKQQTTKASNITLDEILNLGGPEGVEEATFRADMGEEKQPDQRLKAGVAAGQDQKKVKEERVGTKELKRPLTDLERLETFVDYTRRYKEAMASLQFLTDPSKPTELSLAIGADTKEVFKETAKKLGETAPVPPNYQNSDPDRNQGFIQAALAAAASVVGSMRTGDPLAGGTAGMQVMAGGLEGQAELRRQKDALNATLQKEYTSNVKDYRDSVEKTHGDFLKQSGANERKQLGVAARHWNNKMRTLNDQRVTTLNERKAKLEQMKTIHNVDQTAVESEQKIIDTRVDNLKAIKSVQTDNANRNLNAQIATNAAIARASRLQLDTLNSKHNKILFSKTEKVARYTPAPLFAGNQLVKARPEDVQFASSNLHKHYETRKVILDQYKADKLMRSPELRNNIDKMIENSIAWGMWSLNNKDAVIYDYSPEFLLNSEVTKTGVDQYKGAWELKHAPVIDGVPVKKGQKMDEIRSMAAQNFFELANVLIGEKEKIEKISYDGQLRDLKTRQELDKLIIKTGIKKGEEIEDIEERFEDVGRSEEEAERATKILR